jgi:hypothetical protein
MSSTSSRTIIDGDGHVFEDLNAIKKHIPGKFGEAFASGALTDRHLMPPHGGFHAMPARSYGLEGRQPPGVEGWLEFLEGVPIEHSVLYPTWGLHIGLERDEAFAPVLCRAYNDWVTETYTSHPSGKFSAVALIPMQTPAEAAKEIRRAKTDLGLVAGLVPSHGLSNHLGSSLYWPAYEAAEEVGLPLSFHGAWHQGYGFDDLNSFAAAHALGHPFGLLITLAGLTFNGVYDRFPGLRTAYLEGGSAWMLLALERFAESFGAFQPVEYGTMLQLADGQKVDDYLVSLMQAERLMIGVEGGESQLANVGDTVGCFPFLYASDFPHEVDIESCRHEIEEFSELGLSAEQQALVLGDNARKFYNLKA